MTESPPANRRLPLWLSAALVILMAVTLRMMGRTWWCACGGWSPWYGDAYGSHNSQHLIDPYSLTHVLHGVIFCGALSLAAPRLSWGWRLFLATVLECAWEVVENSPFVVERYRNATIAAGYVGDSVVNSVGDALCCAFGFWLAGKIGLRWSLAFAVAAEVLLLLWIRDSLGLNVLMLLYPIDAVRTWQAG